MRIIAITVATLLTVAALLTMARIWGLGQRHPVFEHPYFSQDLPVIAVRVSTLPQAVETVQRHPQAILWLDVRFSRDQKVFVLPPGQDHRFMEAKTQAQQASPQQKILIGGKVSEYPYADLQEFFKTVPQLYEFYERLPEARFIINLVDNVSEAHLMTVAAIKDFNPDKRTLVQSETLILMAAVKEQKPEWLYGTSVPDLVRLLIFDSLYILPSTVFKGDVFIAPFKLKNRPAFNDEIIAEMRRRNKRVILGPINTAEELQRAQTYKADGYVTENLPELLTLLGQGPV